MKFAIVALLTCSLAVVPSSASGRSREKVDPASEAAARVALDRYAHCIAERQPRESERVLTKDFRSTEYKVGLKLLAAEGEKNCAEDSLGKNIMRSSGLLFAGSVAENLLELGGEPINVRLVRAHNATAESFAPTDAIAQCLARLIPDEVAALFGTEPGSIAEQKAATSLSSLIDPCRTAAGIDRAVSMSVPAMRAMVATASLRLVAKSENHDA